MQIAEKIASGLSLMGVPTNEEKINKLVDYLRLLAKWNKTYNLTAVRQIEDMVPRHLLDSLSIAGYVHGSQVCDLGSGAGLPGIPLAINFPEIEFVLIDSNSKKTVFLGNVCRQLGLANVSIVRSRLEDYAPEVLFDTLVTRAVASAEEILRMGGHLCKDEGEILLMKSRSAEAELTNLLPNYKVAAVEQIYIPALEADRKLVRIIKLSEKDG